MTAKFKKTASMLALLAAAGVMAGGVVPTTARAADLGGDCCADLEERVGELEATAVKKGNKKVSLTITGRVNANFMAWSENGPGLPAAPVANDHTSDIYFGNVGRNESRIQLKGEGNVNSDLVAGFEMEIRSDMSQGGNDTQTSHQEGGWTPSGRATYVFLSSKSMGQLRLGYIDASINDTFTKTDLAVDVIGKHSQTTKDALRFFLRDTSGKLTSVTYRSVLQPLEDTKENRLMYISPTYEGFTFKADVGGDDLWGASLNYKNEFKTVKVAASIGYQEAGGVDGGSRVGGQPIQFSSSGTDLVGAGQTEKMFSVAGSIFEVNSGLFLTGEYSTAYANNSLAPTHQNVTEWFAKAGWQKNVTAIGNTSVYASWEQQNNLFKNDVSGHVVAVGIDQELDEAATDLYLQYQRASLDNATTAGAAAIPTQSIDQVIGGMIIKF